MNFLHMLLLFQYLFEIVVHTNSSVKSLITNAVILFLYKTPFSKKGEVILQCKNKNSYLWK